jgi:hypothetical protein
VKFQIESDLKTVVHCHCQFCSKAHGAAFVTILLMPASGLSVIQGEELIARHRIEKLDADRCFCKKCGTRLFNHRPAANRVSVVVATLKLDQPLRPLAHFNTESKCTWFEILDDLPQFAAAATPEEFKRLLAG